MFIANCFILLITLSVAQASFGFLLPFLPSIVKPGFCPAPVGSSYTGACAFTCRSDLTCFLSNKKCCPRLCGGTTCVSPRAFAPVTTTTIAPVTKAGICPVPVFPNKASCFLKPQFAKCVKDADCTGTLKCCTNGCVLTCRTDAVPKSGFCPSPLGSSYTGACLFNCRTDAYCTLNNKCCATLCGGNVCVAPVAVEPVTTTTVAPATKTGACPAPTYPTKDSCYLTSQVAGCIQDADCSGTQKCCTNGCVLTCRAALP